MRLITALIVGLVVYFILNLIGQISTIDTTGKSPAYYQIIGVMLSVGVFAWIMLTSKPK